jgi:membrane protease YdiL (CAAX protease family)
MMPFMRRLLSYALIQMLIEVAGVALLLLLLTTLFAHLPKTLYDSIFFIVLLAVLVAGWFLLMGRFLERRSPAQIGLPRQHMLRDLLLGFLLGVAMMATIIGIMALSGWYRITSIAPIGAIAGPLLATFLYFGATAVWEETVFRGIVFRLLERALGSWIAVILSALLFGLLHLMSPHATLIGALAIAATGGVVSAGLYMLTRNLWSVFGLHWAWNFFEGPIFGTSVSGGGTSALLHSVTHGPIIWTGGVFGPEAGLVSIFIGGAVALVLLVFAVRRHRVFAPRLSPRVQPIPASTYTKSV